MRVTARIIRNWADEGGIPDLTLAELDYRLVHALRAIYTDPFLRDRLYLKGGTALSKLYLPGQGRLSVDLDFNAVGPKERVLEERTQIRQAVMRVLEQQDSSYDFTYRWRYNQAARGIEYPLAWLMEGLPISTEAAVMTQEDIKLHLPGAAE